MDPTRCYRDCRAKVREICAFLLMKYLVILLKLFNRCRLDDDRRQELLRIELLRAVFESDDAAVVYILCLNTRLGYSWLELSRCYCSCWVNVLAVRTLPTYVISGDDIKIVEAKISPRCFQGFLRLLNVISLLYLSWLSSFMFFCFRLFQLLPGLFRTLYRYQQVYSILNSVWYIHVEFFVSSVAGVYN